MKTNQFLVAVLSTTITTGVLISNVSAAQACFTKGVLNYFNTPNNLNNIKTVTGTAALSGLIVGGVFSYRRKRQIKDSTNKAAIYQALEFPPHLTKTKK